MGITEKTSPICANCKHAREVPFDGHVRCDHPIIGGASDRDIVNLNMSMLSPRDIQAIKDASKKLNIKIDRYGFARGFAMWPFDFNPIWILNCEGKESV